MPIWDEWPQLFRGLAALLAQLDRKRQFLERWRLLGNREIGTCAICGNEYPADLLVAAHIKRRADCTDTEKRDHSPTSSHCASSAAMTSSSAAISWS